MCADCIWFWTNFLLFLCKYPVYSRISVRQLTCIPLLFGGTGPWAGRIFYPFSWKFFSCFSFTFVDSRDCCGKNLFVSYSACSYSLALRCFYLIFCVACCLLENTLVGVQKTFFRYWWWHLHCMGGWTRWCFHFLVLFFFFPFVSSLSSLSGVFISPVSVVTICFDGFFMWIFVFRVFYL